MGDSKHSVDSVSFYGWNDSNLILCIPHCMGQLVCYLQVHFRNLLQFEIELIQSCKYFYFSLLALPIWNSEQYCQLSYFLLSPDQRLAASLLNQVNNPPKIPKGSLHCHWTKSNNWPQQLGMIEKLKQNVQLSKK